MSLTIGARVGSFEITAALGAGGMGEVWRAHDTKLDRDVALKVLPASFAQDSERLARLQREAKVLAGLNHPHVAQIYCLEESQGFTGLVLELVEGPTLADLLARGALATDEALAIGLQIAEALETAHEQGIVHRDLKPANIKVRPDGAVKVLDFGLAKALDEAGDAVLMGLSQAPTLTAPALRTSIGTLLGTAAYMSPEQVRSIPVDRRADIWAFGCLMYEMLTGRRAFGGRDVAETLAAVLTSDPDWSRLPEHTPIAIARLIQRCVERDIKRRVPNMSVARFELAGAGILRPRRHITTITGSGGSGSLGRGVRSRRRGLVADQAGVSSGRPPRDYAGPGRSGRHSIRQSRRRDFRRRHTCGLYYRNRHCGTSVHSGAQW
jgi:serine/threonine protein kinase